MLTCRTSFHLYIKDFTKKVTKNIIKITLQIFFNPYFSDSFLKKMEKFLSIKQYNISNKIHAINNSMFLYSPSIILVRLI